jgi:AcrR family transcriptional regulator
VPVTAESADRRERRKARTKEQIVDAATDLFNRYGYDAVTVEQIAETADVALRTYYNYFDTKAAVALARFHQWMDDLGTALADQPAGLSPPEILAGALATVSEQGYAGDERLRTPEGRSILPAPAAVLLSESDPEVAGQVYQRLVQAFRQLSRLFESRLDYPEGSVEPQAVASALVALWFVVVHGRADAEREGSASPVAVNELALQTFGLYSDGLAKVWEQSMPRRTQPAGRKRPQKPA